LRSISARISELFVIFTCYFNFDTISCRRTHLILSRKIERASSLWRSLNVISWAALCMRYDYPIATPIFRHFVAFIYCRLFELVALQNIRKMKCYRYSDNFSLQNSRGSRTPTLVASKHKNKKVLIWQFNYQNKILKSKIINSVFFYKKINSDNQRYFLRNSWTCCTTFVLRFLHLLPFHHNLTYDLRIYPLISLFTLRKNIRFEHPV